MLTHLCLRRATRLLIATRSFSSQPVRTMIKYMTGDDLARMMKSDKTPAKDFLVIDVRDDDYAGGNIKGARNYPSREFLLNVDKLVSETKNVPVMVFHCTLSQVRGPKAARMYQETRQNIIDDAPDQDVYVLRNGFSDFQIKYKDDPLLVENWDKDVWASDWS